MKKDEVMRNRIKFWSDREIRAALGGANIRASSNS